MTKLEDTILRTEMGMRGRSIVEQKYTLEKMVTAYYTLYGGLLQ